MNDFSLFFKKLAHFEFWPTALFLVFLILIRFLLIRSFLKIPFKDLDVKRKWLFSLRLITGFVIVVVLLLIWKDELHAFALSFAAAAVAVVLAFKEMLSCVLASLMRASTKQFDVGDRITISEYRGEVIEYDLLTTTLYEIGPGHTSNQYTGRKIKIPNSLFLNKSLIITPKGDHYTLNIFVVPFDLNQDLFKKQDIMQGVAEAVLGPYFEVAKEYITHRCKKQGVGVPDLTPRVLYEVTSPNTAEFYVRMPMPFNRLTRTENKVKDMYFAECFKQGLV